MKKTLIYLSIILNLSFISVSMSFIHKKGGISYLVNKIQKTDSANIRWEEKIANYLPSVDGRVLFIGDSHLALQQWNEYTEIKFSNRAVSGYKVENIDLDTIKGKPIAVVLSIGTNDIQFDKNTGATNIHLRGLLKKIKSKWKEATYIYVSPPNPNIFLYEHVVRRKFPHATRPTPESLNDLAECAKSEGFTILYSKSASIDGLHIDPDSAKIIVKEIGNILANQPDQTR